MLKAGQIVKVKWTDSSTTEGWVKRGRLREAAEIESCGIVVEDGPATLTLTTSVANGQICLDPISIPWGAIERVEEVK